MFHFFIHRNCSLQFQSKRTPKKANFPSSKGCISWLITRPVWSLDREWPLSSTYKAIEARHTFSYNSDSPSTALISELGTQPANVSRYSSPSFSTLPRIALKSSSPPGFVFKMQKRKPRKRLLFISSQLLQTLLPESESRHCQKGNIIALLASSLKLMQVSQQKLMRKSTKRTMLNEGLLSNSRKGPRDSPSTTNEKLPNFPQAYLVDPSWDACTTISSCVDREISAQKYSDPKVSEIVQVCWICNFSKKEIAWFTHGISGSSLTNHFSEKIIHAVI